ncbi:G-protein coupled receptor Mth-like [Cataglyphis hispanica]|uniref:G-protein coupled receptor Mth-like n=1 Tax=Cataglyphis hispanica TaxID=1086592 RepID=UPI0021807EAB|nr:G-protein coupled receptor Mth-like [Cataglyphis hispanica]
MCGENLKLWYYAFLIFVLSSESLQNFTNDKQNNNSMAKYKLHVNFIRKHNNETEFIRNNDSEDDDLMQYRVSTRFVKYSEEANKMSMKLGANFTKIDNDSNSNNEKENDNKNSISHEKCDNITCIQLCCPLGNHLINGSCISGTHTDKYIFPKVNNNTLDMYGMYDISEIYDISEMYNIYNDLNNESKRVDEFFQLIVRNQCQENQYVSINPNSQDDRQKFIIFANGILYLPIFGVLMDSTSYCLAVANHSHFIVITCEEMVIDRLNGRNYAKEFFYKHLTIYWICRIMSILCMLIIFLVYSIFPELNSIHSFILHRYSSMLLIQYMTEIIIRTEIINQIYFCIVEGLVMYFCSLANAFWLNVMSFNMWCTFRKIRSLQRNVKQQETKKLMYSICVWGGSLILTIICIIIELIPNNSMPNYMIRPQFDTDWCWFGDSVAYQFYYLWPISICFINSISLFISTALKITRYEKATARHLGNSESRSYNDNKRWFNLYLKLFTMLFILMIVNWIITIISAFLVVPVENIASLLYIANSKFLMDTIQDIGFLIIFVCRKTIMRLLLKRFCQNRESVPKTSTRMLQTLTN